MSSGLPPSRRMQSEALPDSLGRVPAEPPGKTKPTEWRAKFLMLLVR